MFLEWLYLGTVVLFGCYCRLQYQHGLLPTQKLQFGDARRAKPMHVSLLCLATAMLSNVLVLYLLSLKIYSNVSVLHVCACMRSVGVSHPCVTLAYVHVCACITSRALYCRRTKARMPISSFCRCFKNWFSQVFQKLGVLLGGLAATLVILALSFAWVGREWCHAGHQASTLGEQKQLMSN